MIREDKHFCMCFGCMYLCVQISSPDPFLLIHQISVFFLLIYVSSLNVKCIHFLLTTLFGNNYLSWFLNFNCGVPDHKMKSQHRLELELLSKIKCTDYSTAK